ncbi:MAG: copper chaperone PCu(A)C [Pseudomonadota bacterium]
MRDMITIRGLIVGVLALAAGTSTVAAHSVKTRLLEIVHPWVHETTARGGDAVVSMRIRNNGKRPDRLIGATTPAATSIEIVASAPAAPAKPGATPPPSLVIPPGAIELGRSSAHLVMKGLQAPLTAYAMVPMTLRFERAGAVEIEVMVEERSTDDPHAGHK